MIYILFMFAVKRVVYAPITFANMDAQLAITSKKTSGGGEINLSEVEFLTLERARAIVSYYQTSGSGMTKENYARKKIERH